MALANAGDADQRHNKDPEVLFRKAIDATRKATEIDDRYAIAFNNMSVYLNALAEWKADHGADPEKVVLESVEAADRAIAINKQQPLPYGSSGWALTITASYRLDAGQDGREPARRAIDRLEAVRAIDPGAVFYQRWLARAYHLLAEHERAQGLDPRPSLGKGLDVIAACYRVEAGNADCKAVEAELRAAQAAWTTPVSLKDLEQAERLASEAAQKLADRADLWLSLAQVCLDRADAMVKGAAPPADLGPVLDEGLRAAETALAKAPGSPRALAILGALSMRRAGVETDEGRRRAAEGRAKENLTKAFAGDPLLERRYGAALREAGKK